MTVKCAGLPSPYLEEYWDAVAPLLLKDMPETYELEDVRKALDNRDMQLWGCWEGIKLLSVFVTEIVVYPRLKVLRIVIGAGERATECVEALRGIVIEWGKAQGCDTLEITGRPGWKRVFDTVFGKDWLVEQAVLMRGRI